jgi:hypothetical protein
MHDPIIVEQFYIIGIDLIQKSTNQQGQTWQLIFYFRFSVIILSQQTQNSWPDSRPINGYSWHVVG